VTIENEKSSAKFVHQSFVEFYIAFYALELTNDEFEEEIALKSILQSTDDTYLQTLQFIDSFCSIESNNLPKNLKNYLENNNADKLPEFLKLIKERVSESV